MCRLEWICQNENIEFDSSAIDELIELCDGDMRKSITALQVELLFIDTNETKSSNKDETLK